ncbi:MULTISPECIES: sigma-54-dependent transcriptional regulator [unclassified Shinella]|jgi:two-component system C4-dicarboxylate transport response regulator DctD|uniref:sigma-54-dependent transcriptional regulator n=1 Tax=unclassified Shinella TaxID=2643062 RepID=UPI00234E817F|nr:MULTISPECIES: sigma-54 dependent transcriptional regulator [unclassified Shinella]MCA0340741.1 sigma-54 dependent transcriptional regulator [Pseudomonadota bacterium]MCO5149189.1 sigma-54 dependent transcriptional regulator [Shinella sp.]MDC7265247.1 sigma-54 dependent transcriptional regulator [Shinella sp. HY16]MDC7272144.1 sigma-54 dependent transcriptional regulator [Shinella sp. YZ44]MDG4673028.1 sigma-54 dependent transcriptional regulator [Shinella sp. 838]
MTASTDIILVDDDANVLDACRELLEIEGFRVSAHGSVAAALSGLQADSEAVIVSDVRMPQQDGFDLLAAVRAIDREIPIVLMTGHGDIPMALRAMRDGAWDFLEKPADPVHLIETVRRALAHRRLLVENRRLRLSVAMDGWEARLIGHSAPMVLLRERLQRIAGAATDILVLGETGTGKEVTARALHDFSGRKGRFVAVNCGAIPETMLESELFGHEAGAFTGAKDKRIGKIEHADGGTLFLDEIESMPLSAQVRLLRVLQERVIERLGSNDEVAVDLQVVAATKADLHQLARQGRFREDLAYRLDIARVELPALSARRGDVALLFRHFLDLAARRQGRAAPHVDATFLADLDRRSWPGNVRELRNVAERYVLGLEDLPVGGSGSSGETLEARMDRVERAILVDSLAEQDGRIGTTADALGISRKTLYLKMRKHGLGGEEEA